MASTDATAGTTLTPSETSTSPTSTTAKKDRKYVTQIHSWRLIVQEKFLCRLHFYNNLKDGYKGGHERDIIRIVNRFQQITKYNLTDSERQVYRKASLTTAGLSVLGFFMPIGLLISKTMRDTFANTRKKRMFGLLFCCTLGYGNYIGSYSNYLKNLLHLDNSCMAYTAFQVMCQPDYRKFRNKWQTQYNLSAIAHRYQRFDFENEMKQNVNNMEKILAKSS